MENREFKAFVTEETAEGEFLSSVKSKKLAELNHGDLTIKVCYSSINYKDALSVKGNKGVTRNYPHTPGIDAVGIVEKSGKSNFSVGDEVIVTGYEFGTNMDGGFAEYAQFPSEWAIRLPQGLSMREAAILGTAGLTTGLSVFYLSEQTKLEDGPVVVSGATGGVGSLAVALLSKLGYEVTAITGKAHAYDFLHSLGAKEIRTREEFGKQTDKMLLHGEWSGGIDTTGGPLLENMLKSARLLATITTCGNVASTSLHLSSYPFIIRGVRLIGITAQNCPARTREIIWNRFAHEWSHPFRTNIAKEISMEEIPDYVDKMLVGKNQGRVIVKM